MTGIAARIGAWMPAGLTFDASGPAVSAGNYRISRSDVLLLALAFLTSRIVLIVFTVLSYAANTARLEVGPQDMFCNWDCDWYIGIAQNGYVAVADADKHGVANWAFFPALPMAMRVVAQLTGLPVVWSGVVLANLAAAGGLYLMFLLASDLGGRRFGRHAALVYAFWPFAVHAAQPMTEALFVPLSIGIFLWARRGNWLLAGLAAAVLSATRTVGILAFLPMLMLATREFGLWRLATLRPGCERAVVALALSGVGLGLYMIYLYGLTGDALAFSHNQNAWNRTFKLPWMMLLDEFNPAYIDTHWLIANACNAATGIVGLLLLRVLWRQGLAAEVLFAGAALLLAFDTGTTNSLPRYTGGLFPIMLAVAYLTDTPMMRRPAIALAVAGEASLAFAWGMEQFYVM